MTTRSLHTQEREIKVIWRRAKQPAIHMDVFAGMRREGYGNFSRRQERILIARVKPGWSLGTCELVAASPLFYVAS